MSANRPVFVSIETTSFSGATLLAFLLNAHPQIAAIGEMNGLISKEDPEMYVCSCGQRIKDCDFWRSVKSAMGHLGLEFDVQRFDLAFTRDGPRFVQYLQMGSLRSNTLDSIRDRLFTTWPGEKRRLNTLVLRNEAFVQAVLGVTGKTVFIDTSKDRLRLKYLRRFSTLDVRAVHLVRDVRGVVASWLRRGRADIREAACQWVKWHQRLEVALQALPKENYIQVRYEDLCQDVQGTLERVFHLCGVDPADMTADFRAVSHHIVGNEMRLKNLSEVRLDERWKRLLTEDQLKEIDRAAGRWNRQYGYL